MITELLHKRDDGSFVATVNGMPYHITVDDALYADAERLEADLETPLAPEPTPDAAPLAPLSITRRQCARQLLAMQLITPAEALAMTQTGAAPAMVAASLSQLPEPDKTLALIDFAADTYLRSNPLLISLMTATGATSAEIDAFFAAAATH